MILVKKTCIDLSEGSDMCEIEGICTFFSSVEGCRNTIRAVQENLCRGDHTNCARYVVHMALGPEAVSDDLLPTDHIAAERITGQAVKEAG